MNESSLVVLKSIARAYAASDPSFGEYSQTAVRYEHEIRDCIFKNISIEIYPSDVDKQTDVILKLNEYYAEKREEIEMWDILGTEYTTKETTSYSIAGGINNIAVGTSYSIAIGRNNGSKISM